MLTLTSDDFHSKRWVFMPVNHMDTNESGRYRVLQVRMS